MDEKEYEFGQARRNMRRGPGDLSGRMGGGEKAKDLIGTWKKLLIYCKKYAAVFVLQFAVRQSTRCCSCSASISFSDIAGYIEAGLMTGNIDLNAIIKVCVTLVCFYAASWLLSTVQHWMMAMFTQRVSKTMCGDISRKINLLPIWYYNRNTTGDVLSRVINDVDTIGQSLNQSVGNMISQIVLFLGSLLMMLITNWIMALTAVLATLVGFVLMMAIMGRSQKYFSSQQKNLGVLNGHIEEI